MRTVTIPVIFEIGSLDELGYGAFKQPWISARKNDIEFDLTCGAGLGNSLLEASAAPEYGKAAYARTDISTITPLIWNELQKEMNDD